MRSKSGAARNQSKKRLFKAAKGFVGGRRRLLKSAKETLLRAGMFAFRDRRAKKRDFRKLFITRLSAAAEMRGPALQPADPRAEAGQDRARSQEPLRAGHPRSRDLRRDRRAGPRGTEPPRRGRQVTPARCGGPLSDRSQDATMSSTDPLESALVDLERWRPRAEPPWSAASTPEALEAARIEFLGQKQGRVKAAQERLKTLDPAGKRATASGSTASSKPSRRPSRRPDRGSSAASSAAGDRRHAPRNPSPPGPSPSPDPDRRRADRPVRPVRLQRGPRPRGRGHPAQLRRPQYSRRPIPPATRWTTSISPRGPCSAARPARSRSG